MSATKTTTKKKAPTKKRATHAVAVYLPTPLFEELKKIAEQEGRSYSWIMAEAFAARGKKRAR